jgi:hypothetical protein
MCVARVGKVQRRWVRAGGAQLVAADEEGGWDVVFLGDSLFEPWRGTKMGQPWAAYADIPATWTATFGQAYGKKAHVMAISGAPRGASVLYLQQYTCVLHQSVRFRQALLSKGGHRYMGEVHMPDIHGEQQEGTDIPV